MLNLVHKLLFGVSIFCAIANGIYVAGKVEMLWGSPWHILALLGVALLTHFFINGFILNKVIFRRQVEENTPVFELTEEGALFGYPHELKQELTWEKVTKIEILTSSEGPWSEDLWWAIFQEGMEEPALIPNCTKNITAIFEVLETRFNGVSMENIQKAMGSTSNAQFLIWQKTHNNLSQQDAASGASA